MRQWLYGTLALLFLMTLSGPPVYGYGGGSGGEGGTSTSMTDLAGGEGSTPPAGFTPVALDQEYDFDLSPAQTTSTGPTAVTGEPETLSPEELQQLQAAFDFILITSGGIVLGYSVAAAGWSVLGQAAAGGFYSGATTYFTSDENAGEQAVAAGLQDVAIGVVFSKLPPPAQAAISQGVTKIREQLPDTFNSEGASLSQLQRSYDWHYAW